jgi:8-oxo-dGTP diphosphatase
VLEWVPKEEMGKLNLWEGDLVFLRLMEAGVPFFSMKLVYRDGVLEQVVLNGAPLTRRGFGQWN